MDEEDENSTGSTVLYKKKSTVRLFLMVVTHLSQNIYSRAGICVSCGKKKTFVLAIYCTVYIRERPCHITQADGV